MKCDICSRKLTDENIVVIYDSPAAKILGLSPIEIICKKCNDKKEK